MGRFAESLDAAMRVFPSARWARVVGVSEREVLQWREGVAAPPPHALHLIVMILRDCAPGSPERAALEAVLDEPSSDVTSHDCRMHPKPGSYMLAGLRDAMLSALDALPTREQEAFIVRAIREISRTG